jgi:4-amino-4-deoxy-L-arabinose transferase-like glycosyltransferase
LIKVFQENITRYYKPYDHKGPVYLYLGVVPLLTAPWIPFFFGAIIGSIKSWKKLGYNTRWLITSIVLIFVFFTISGSRRNYYILPILPFCMLLIAIYLTKSDIFVKNLMQDLKNQKYTLLVIAILEMIFGPLVTLILIYKYNWELPGLLGWSFLIIGAAALLPLIIARYVSRASIRPSSPKSSPRMHGQDAHATSRLQPIWVQIMTAGILLGGFFAWQYNILDMTRTEQPFALQMKTLAQSFAHERVAFWKMKPDKQLFYMNWDLPVTMLDDEKELQKFLDNDKPGIIITQGRRITETVASMLPENPAYTEENRAWETPHMIYQNKFKAWIINPDNKQIVTEERDANYAE